MVKIDVEKLDDETKGLVDRYEKLSQVGAGNSGQSVDDRIAAIEAEIGLVEGEASENEASLATLNARLAIYDQEMKRKKAE